MLIACKLIESIFPGPLSAGGTNHVGRGICQFLTQKRQQFQRYCWACFPAIPAAASPFLFSTGNPDGLIATLSRTASAGKLETETADDFVTTVPTRITNATFTGLFVGGATPANVNDVEIELYHVFPIDSVNPPDGRVNSCVNSPSEAAP